MSEAVTALLIWLGVFALLAAMLYLALWAIRDGARLRVSPRAEQIVWFAYGALAFFFLMRVVVAVSGLW